ncbi:MAG: hypothetical protein KJ984_03565, partial [Nanoarchaeota archaeon]|nr:hypothetical protein [Nanoarchaeota archaeon]
AIFYSGYVKGKDDELEKIGKGMVYPPLSNLEKKILDDIKDNPEAIQHKIDKWINDDENDLFPDNSGNYFTDTEQFQGSLCTGGEAYCDIWAPAVHFLRTKAGDCDDVLLFAHYSLGGKGYGIYLNGKNEKNETIGHAIYVYPGSNGKYGIISINSCEQTGSIYTNLEEIAESYSESFDFYQVLTLPDNEETLLYDFNGKRETKFGEKRYFIKKKSETPKEESASDLELYPIEVID